ncbi:MAG TPA: hypothetical protein VJZ03_07435 [Candidatus Bathyarchaeia archaeon]|nr:hypothetical protein [Candidatus Bathyarchaeia archaeon]
MAAASAAAWEPEFLTIIRPSLRNVTSSPLTHLIIMKCGVQIVTTKSSNPVLNLDRSNLSFAFGMASIDRWSEHNLKKNWASEFTIVPSN